MALFYIDIKFEEQKKLTGQEICMELCDKNKNECLCATVYTKCILTRYCIFVGRALVLCRKDVQNTVCTMRVVNMSA